MNKNRLEAFSDGVLAIIIILQSAIVAQQGHGGPLAMALGRDWKGKASPVIYLAGIGLALVHPLLGMAAYIGVALLWLVPDRRLERSVMDRERATG